MYPRQLISGTLLFTTAMSESQNETRDETEEMYLPAMTARPTLGWVESLFERCFGRYGIVPVPYDAVKP